MFIGGFYSLDTETMLKMQREMPVASECAHKYGFELRCDMENKYKEKKLHCVKIKLDTDVSDFLKDYYRKRMKRRQELKAQV